VVATSLLAGALDAERARSIPRHTPVVPVVEVRRRRVLFFGTYDAARYPRVQVLREGFEAVGDEVLECNEPLGLDTADRVRMLRQPWRIPLLAAKLGRAWLRLSVRARTLPPVDLVVVGYMGHFDVHLARRLFPDTPIVLDHLVFAADTARDRGAGGGRVLGLLERLDRAALRAADIPCVETADHLGLVSDEDRDRARIVPVGAPEYWFRRPRPERRAPGRPLRAWIDWLEPDRLAETVAEHDVCLGIFGTGPKALRVVPNKVFQGAAAGAAILTSDTAPQREALGEDAVFVAPGDPAALAEALTLLAGDHNRVERLRETAFARADSLFRPRAVIAPLEGWVAA
jgi:hypothetical protein